MKEIVIGTVVALVTAAAMEPWARLLHRHVWHRRLWSIHRSHHEPRHGRFEKNDALSFLHAPIAMAAIMVGCQLSGPARASLIGFGVGMTLFGAAYVTVHDGLIHERFGLRWLLRFRLFRRVRAAHLVHHKFDGAPYGLFLGPDELKRRRRASPPSIDNQ